MTYILEESQSDRFGNDKLTYGYGTFTVKKYKGKGNGKLKLNQCKEKCYRNDFPIPILYNKVKNTGRCQIYSAKLKSMGLAKCKQCEYITSESLPIGTRCGCCSRILSHHIKHNQRFKSEFYIEPKRIE